MLDTNFKFEKDGPVAVLTMLQGTMDIPNGWCDDIEEALDIIDHDPEIRVAILCSADRFFCAGSKLSGRKGEPRVLETRRNVMRLGKIVEKIGLLSKPIIALVDGAAAGGGANLALACDFVLASEKAFFAEVFANINYIPDTGGLWTLVRAVGPMRAKYMAMTTSKIYVEEADKYGMITEVVPSERLMERGMELAKLIAKKPPAPLSFIKEICWRIPEMDHATYIEYEATVMEILRNMRDHKEGVAAFLEKREPHFTNE